MESIRAAVLREYEQLSIERVDLAEPAPNEVRVEMRATGVCHTDYGAYRGDEFQVPTPIVLGHEGAGVVEAVGDQVTTVEPGDNVVLWVLPTCGLCDRCEEGRPFLCQRKDDVKFSTLLDGTRRLSVDGEELNHFMGQSSFATKAVVSERSVVRIPDDATLESAALLGCGASTGIGAVMNTADVVAGETVAVFGCGGLGSSAIMAARAVSAGAIIAVDIDASKLDNAELLGATAVVNSAEVEPVEHIRTLTDGGVDYALEFVGNNPRVRKQAIESTRAGGTVVLSGAAGPAEQLEIPIQNVLPLGKEIRGNLAGNTRPQQDIPRWIRLHEAGAIDLDRLVSKRYELAELENAFEDLEAGNVIRGVVTYD